MTEANPDFRQHSSENWRIPQKTVCERLQLFAKKWICKEIFANLCEHKNCLGTFNELLTNLDEPWQNPKFATFSNVRRSVRYLSGASTRAMTRPGRVGEENYVVSAPFPCQPRRSVHSWGNPMDICRHTYQRTSADIPGGILAINREWCRISLIM